MAGEIIGRDLNKQLLVGRHQRFRTAGVLGCLRRIGAEKDRVPRQGKPVTMMFRVAFDEGLFNGWHEVTTPITCQSRGQGSPGHSR